MRIDIRLTNRTAMLPALDPTVYKNLRAQWSFSPKGLWHMPRYKPTKLMRAQYAVTVKQIETLKNTPNSKNRARIKTLSAALADMDTKLATMWDGRISLIDHNAVSSGLFRATWHDVEKECGVHFSVKKNRQTVDFVDGLSDAIDQYRHQNDCVHAMQVAIPRGGGIVLAATSSGKTGIAARLFSKVTCPCLFVVDQLDLLYQQKEELEGWLHEEVGVVGDSIFDPKRVTVATIQTLSLHAKRKGFIKWFQTIDIMIVDELHEAMAKRNFDVLRRVKPVAIFGLTATLQLGQKETRLKAYAFAGPVIFRFPIEEGVKRGVLAKGYVLQLLFPDATGVDNDYQTDLVLQVTQNELKLSACVALTNELMRMDRHELILVDRVSHLHDVDDVLKHIPHELAYGEIAVKDRRQSKEHFEDGDIKLLIANKVFKKGTSIKRIDAMIDMAEGKSKNDPVQKFGRGLRLHTEKSEFLYLDFGTQGHGRFAAAATSRRRALKKAGISVTTVQVNNEAEAVSALKKFARKVGAHCHESKPKH